MMATAGCAEPSAMAVRAASAGAPLCRRLLTAHAPRCTHTFSLSLTQARFAIYSGDGLSGDELVRRAAKRFGVRVPRVPRVAPLRLRTLVEDRWYPVATVLGQSLGSVVLTAEALLRLRPRIFVDTAGYAFGYPLAAVCGARVAAYVHYPTVSSDMLSRVRAGGAMYNNRGLVARSALAARAKLLYYRAMMAAYSCAGRCAAAAAANSSWTRRHIERLWGGAVRTVFPPCDNRALAALPIDRERMPLVLSVAQFRPEKDQLLQVRAFAAALSLAKESAIDCSRWQLVIAGATRNAADRARCEAVRNLADSLGVAAQVRVAADVPLDELRSLMRRARAGLHTMLDEHFGISVVDFMAAGVVPIAHRSAGPKEDIVSESGECGYLAASESEYAETIVRVLAMPAKEYSTMAARGRARAARFSEEAFERALVEWLVADGVLPAKRRTLASS